MPNRTLSPAAIPTPDEVEHLRRTIAERDLEVARLREANIILRENLQTERQNRDYYKMLLRDQQIVAMDRGASFQVAVAEIEKLRARLALVEPVIEAAKAFRLARPGSRDALIDALVAVERQEDRHD